MHPFLLKLSHAVLILGSSFDAGTSFNHQELNPFLSTHGQFQGRGLTIKSGLTLGTILLERKLVKKHPALEKPFAVGNFVVGSTLFASGIRNLKIQ